MIDFSVFYFDLYYIKMFKYSIAHKTWKGDLQIIASSLFSFLKKIYIFVLSINTIYNKQRNKK